MLTNNQIAQIVKRLVSAAHPSKIILFGSYARAKANEDSDLDLLIIEPELNNKGKEMVRLRNIIGRVGVGVDVLVCSEKEIKEWSHLPGTALYQALKEGHVLYEASH